MFNINNLRPPKILVVGDLMIDHYIWGVCDRVSPEAPVTIVEVQRESRTLGGACNVVHNLLALGASVFPCGVIGKDIVGDEVREKLQQLGIGTEGLIIEENRLSTKKSRIIASNQQVLRVDWEHKQDISPAAQKILLQFVESKIPCVDAVILSDYAKGVLTASVTQHIITQAKAHHKPILVDPKGKDYTKYNHATLLTPNKKEAYEATGIKITDDESLLKCLQMLKQQCNLVYPLITLSEDGIGILHEDRLKKIPTISREVYDVTGAGDTVIASLAFGLASGFSIEQAAEFANAAAAVVVSKIGSATASLQEIKYYHASFQDSISQNTARKIISATQLSSLISELKKQGKKIVWTNGCFDLLHYGHTQYLQEAKSLGDVLIVGINSDESVKRLKGDTRPINSLEDRAGVLSALASVDYIVPFSEETPYALIAQICPDVLVKGGDYAGKEIVGSQFAKEVRTLLLMPNRSSTLVIEKIKKL